jgi:type IV pilus assembly protein PilM
MRLLKGTANYPIGLDISDSGFKYAQLTKKRDHIKIQALGKYVVDDGLINQGVFNDENEVAKTIRAALAKTKMGDLTSNEVVACLPETKTFIKLIEVEKGPNPLKDIIGSEIEKYIPLERKNVYYDFQIIAEEDNKYDILIGAAPRTVVDSYIRTLDKAGLSLLALEIEPVSLCRALLSEEIPGSQTKDDKAYGIVDIGAKRSSFTIYTLNTIIFSISIPTSGHAITQKIAQTLKIDAEQAEKSKIVCGMDKSKAKGIIHDVLKDNMQELTTRIKESLEFYQTHYPDFPDVNKLLLCGGGSNIKNLNELLTENLGVETHLGDAFANLSQTSSDLAKHFTETHNLEEKSISQEKISIQQDTSLNYATAVGLALRRVVTDKI